MTSQLKKTFSNLQSPRSSGRQRSLNISSFKRYLEEPIDTYFNKDQLADCTNNLVTLDLDDLYCD